MKLNEAQFFAEVRKLVASTRREIEAHQLNLDSGRAAIAARRARVLRGDYQFFAYTYFPHHVRGEPSTFQAHFCHRVPQILRHTRGLREWWRAPRGEAKTSLATKITPVWCAVQALLRERKVRDEIRWDEEKPGAIDYIVILGAELRLPTKLLEVVKLELTVNPMLALDFPEVCGKSDVWKVGEFVTRNGVKVEPYGADQAIRGTFHGSERPKLALADDLITDKEAKSPTIREKRWDWLEQAIEYLGPPDGSLKFIGVGTSLNKDDPITRAGREPGHLVHTFQAIEKYPDRMHLWDHCAELMLNEDPAVERAAADRGVILAEEDKPSYRYYAKRRKIMDQGAVTSWPGVRSLYTLMFKRTRNRKAFEAEMQQNPRSDEDRVFTDLRYWVSRLPGWTPFGGCDPSMGQGHTAHPSGLVAGYWCGKQNRLHVAWASQKRRVMSKLQADLIWMQREFACQAIGFENNNAYEAMRQSFIDAGLREQVPLPLVGITATVAPEVRIDALETYINGADPKIVFSHDCRQLASQLEEWPEKMSQHHYDLLIALELCWVVAVRRSGGLPNIVTRAAAGQIDMRGYANG